MLHIKNNLESPAGTLAEDSDGNISGGLATNLIVGYIAAFEDGRADKIGHIALNQPETNPAAIFKIILKVDPSIRESSYIFSNIRSTRLSSSYIITTIEYKKEEIKALISKVIKPGIIRFL